MFAAFPKLLIVLVIYNLAVFGTGWFITPEAVQDTFGKPLFTADLQSGALWTFTINDVFLLVALALLFIEVVKATDTGARAILNHTFSVLVFIACMLEFVILEPFGNSTFFLITCMTLFDVVAGFVISIIAARRDIGVLGQGG